MFKGSDLLCITENADNFVICTVCSFNKDTTVLHQKSINLSFPKANSSHPFRCENLSTGFLPIHHSSYYVLHLGLHQTSHVQLDVPSNSGLGLPLADELSHPTMPSDACFLWRLEAMPPSSPGSNGWFRQDPFSSYPKAVTQVRGQGGLARFPGWSRATRWSRWCSVDCANSGCAESDRPESKGVWVDLIITVAQEQNVDEWQVVQSERRRSHSKLRSGQESKGAIQQWLLLQRFTDGCRSWAWKPVSANISNSIRRPLSL